MTKETDATGSCPYPNPQHQACENVTLHDKRDTADVIRLRALITLEYLSGLSLITSGPFRWKRVVEEESQSDTMRKSLTTMLDSKLKRAISQ